MVMQRNKKRTASRTVLSYFMDLLESALTYMPIYITCT
jgi:hypothetical protein